MSLKSWWLMLCFVSAAKYLKLASAIKLRVDVTTGDAFDIVKPIEDYIATSLRAVSG